MKLRPLVGPAVAAAVLSGLAALAFTTRDHWLPLLLPATSPEATAPPGEPAAATGKIIVNEQAQANLGLTARPLKRQTYWRTVTVPGVVVDRPGESDRNVTARLSGTVLDISAKPGHTVTAGQTLFTLQLVGEGVQTAQRELATAAKEVAIVTANRDRVAKQVEEKVVPPASLVEPENQLKRATAGLTVLRRQLRAFGLSADQIAQVEAGEFVSEVTVSAPAQNGTVFELQELKVNLGETVQAGQTLCVLANHQKLAVEGKAFQDETPLLEQSVRGNWPVEVDFEEDAAAGGWGEVKQAFRIEYVANTIDPATRTFGFWVPLDNQSKVVDGGGKKQTLWRFRPGQKVRLLVRVREMDKVFVLPPEGVTRDGVEAFVFTQNDNTFTRHPVKVLFRDRREVVIADDGTFPAGTFVVQQAAAQLNRMVKAGGASGVPKGYHVHADGSLHKNEDEGK
jgi:multidrug efflux pump subunit AcrA (membrane-fusion protein)